MVAMLSALCSSILRRKTTGKIAKGNDTPQKPPPQPSPMMTPSSSPLQPTRVAENCPNVDVKSVGNPENEQRGQGLLLPLPPAMKSRHSLSHSFSNINHLPRSSSVRKLKSSLSTMTFLRSLSMRKGSNRNGDETESVGHNNGQSVLSKVKKKPDKLKRDDSIWTKTIILGEKCRVPDDDEGVYYDNKGNRISSFRPRTPRSVTLSRSSSFADSSSSSAS